MLVPFVAFIARPLRTRIRTGRAWLERSGARGLAKAEADRPYPGGNEQRAARHRPSRNLSKTYPSGFQALKSIDLDIRRGRDFCTASAPNGAGKTDADRRRLRHRQCDGRHGGRWTVATTFATYRARVRAMIGLVPQELTNRRPSRTVVGDLHV